MVLLLLGHSKDFDQLHNSHSSIKWTFNSIIFVQAEILWRFVLFRRIFLVVFMLYAHSFQFRSLNHVNGTVTFQLNELNGSNKPKLLFSFLIFLLFVFVFVCERACFNIIWSGWDSFDHQSGDRQLLIYTM